MVLEIPLTKKTEDFKTIGYSPTKCFIIYRDEMLKLLTFPKPTHDQLCLLLPTVMGFRANEVCTWRAEYIDFDHGDTLVMDAKKKRLFQIPLNIQVAALTEKLLKDRREGYVLRSRSNRNLGKLLSPFAIWHVWRKWSMRARLFNWEEFSPAVGRRFFAAEWYHRQRLSLMTLSMIMRHSEPRVTLGYVEKLIFYEDLKQDYRKFQFNVLERNLKSEKVAATVKS